MLSFVLATSITFHGMTILLFILDSMDLVSIHILNNLPNQQKKLLFQWNLYVITLCIFHLAEFFITAMYNPSVVNADSFIVNHSKAYTTAMIVSVTEFWTKFVFCPSMNSKISFVMGIILCLGGQLVRSLGMKTCGESFNHIIQHVKKDNHVLVTTGIYKYLRHPSYFGFYYWSIGTQLLVGNVVSTFAFGVSSWFFFNRRIPYEEQTLIRLFPNGYEHYMTTSYIGIPFIFTKRQKPNDYVNSQ